VKVVTSDTGSGQADILIDSIAVFLGSYAQSNPSCTPTGMGAVYHSNYIIGLNDSNLARLKANNNGDAACVIADFGSLYAGQVALDFKSASNATSFVTVYTSTDGVNFNQLGASFSVSSGTLQWFSVPPQFVGGDARYVEISVSYSALHGASDLSVDATYVA
jgi:hypothetical protein